MERRDPATPGLPLQHFTNREKEKDILTRLLNERQGEPLPVVVFYGMGGIGKTWLTQKVKNEVRGQANAEWKLPKLPTARIDFDSSEGGSIYYTDHAAAYAEIVEQLDVDCPRFELAYSMMRYHQTGGDAPEMTGGGHFGTMFRFLTKAAGAASQSITGSIIQATVEELSPHAGRRLRDSTAGQRLLTQVGQQDYMTLQKMRPQDIYPLLLPRLEEDLKENLPFRPGFACRAVLIFDTFEALQLRSGDALVRNLFEQCNYQKHDFLQFVIAGQNQITWDETDAEWRNPQYLEQHLIGGLSELDADRFLKMSGVQSIEERCHIEKGRLQNAIRESALDLESTQQAHGQHAYHPLSLYLLTTAARQETHPDPTTFQLTPGNFDVLAERFLRSLGDPRRNPFRDWIIHLAFTPRFDAQAAQDRYSPHHSQERETAWNTLLDYNFVTETRISGWWTIKSLVRDALQRRASLSPEATQTEQTWWQNYWQSRTLEPTDDFASLAWLHRWHLDPTTAIDEWNALAKQEHAAIHSATHLRLLSWWTDTGIETKHDLTHLDAVALNDLARELLQTALGDRTANLHQAIECCQTALTVLMENARPQEWAKTQNNLGLAYRNLPGGDRAANLHQAIECYKAALTVLKEDTRPQDWAKTQNNLGIAYSDLPDGNTAANLQQAIECYQAVLRVCKEDTLPQEWAMTQNNLGIAYSDLPDGDRTANLHQAIESYQAALRVYREDTVPQEWARTQSNLGIAYSDLPDGDRTANLHQAIECYQVALTVRKEDTLPQEWAMTQNNLGIAYHNLPNGDPAANLHQAIVCYQAALRVIKEDTRPQDWATIQNNLGTVYRDLPGGDRTANLHKAVESYQAALRVYREDTLPQEWAMTQNNLGIAYKDLPDGDLAANLHQAIECYQAALRVYQEDTLPRDWAMSQWNLGIALSEFGDVDAAQQAWKLAARGYRKVGLEQDAQEIEKFSARLQPT